MKRLLVWVFVVAVLVAAGYGVKQTLAAEDTAADEAIATITVKPGELVVSILDTGELSAERSVRIRSQLEGRNAITWVVPEGTSVKKGDRVLELDSSLIKTREESQAIAVAKAASDHVAAEKNYEIQINKNASEVSKATDLLRFARLDLEKFRGRPDEHDPGARLGEKEDKLSAAQSEIDVATEELSQAQNRLRWTRELFEQKYVTEVELKQDELSVQRSRNSVRQKRNAKFILETYTLTRQEEELVAKAREAEAELERTGLRCAAELAQKEAAVKASKRQLDLQNTKLEKIQKQLEKATVRAPGNGLVIYSTIWTNTGRQQPKVGIEVRQGQTLMLLPDLSSMQIRAKVHEAQVDRVEEGQAVTVRVDSFPDRVFSGIVQRIAVLPQNDGNWINPDTKVYQTTVALSGDTSMLRPGQSASAEIHVARLEEVLSVPVTAVQRKGHVNYVWRKSGEDFEARPVSCGLTNDRFVEITEGLGSGDVVALAPPPAVSEPDFGALEDELAAKAKAAAEAAAAAAEAAKKAAAAKEGAEGEATAEGGAKKGTAEIGGATPPPTSVPSPKDTN